VRRRSHERSSSASAVSRWLAETLSTLSKTQNLDKALEVSLAAASKQTGAKSVYAFIENQGHVDQPISIYKSMPVVSEKEIKAVALKSNHSRHRRGKMKGNIFRLPLQSRGRSLGAILLCDSNVNGEQVFALEILAEYAAVTLDNLILCHNEWSRLPNLPAIKPLLARALKRAKGPIAFFFFDIDDFKGVNSQVGYFGGAELLVQIASRLRACTALKPGFLGHISGDEFVLILPLGKRNHARVKEAASAIKSAVQSPFFIQGRRLAITVSIGVSIFPRDAKNIEELFAHADSAALLAKSAGKNAYRVYRPRPKR